MFFDNMYSDPGLTMKRSKKEEISDCNDPGKLSVRMTQKLSDADVSSPAEIQETLRLFSPYPDLDITVPGLFLINFPESAFLPVCSTGSEVISHE